MRFRPLAAACAVSLAAALCVASAKANPYLPPAGKVSAGVSGSITEPGVVPSFDARAGKHAPVVQTFVSWGYTRTRWLRMATAEHARAMVHITTVDGNGHEITPRAIAMGHGDAPIVRLTRAFADSGQVVYVRLMAEMNGSWNPYSAYGPGYKGGAHSTHNFKQAWRRIVLIMRGGPVDQINARLHALGMPSVNGASAALPPSAKSCTARCSRRSRPSSAELHGRGLRVLPAADPQHREQAEHREQHVGHGIPGGLREAGATRVADHLPARPCDVEERKRVALVEARALRTVRDQRPSGRIRH